MVQLNTDIFQTVPKEDYLSLFEKKKGVTHSNRVVNFLEFQKKDVAKAAGIPVVSIRYDEKMPAELRERLREWATLLNLVAEHFQGDTQKTTLWFTTPNPLLGNVTPRDMIRFGRFKKLFAFVLNAIAENRR